MDRVDVEFQQSVFRNNMRNPRGQFLLTINLDQKKSKVQEAVATSYEHSWVDFARGNVWDRGLTSSTGCAACMTTNQRTLADKQHMAVWQLASFHTESGLAWAAQRRQWKRRCVASEAPSRKGITACLDVLELIYSMGSQLPHQEDAQATPWRGLCNRGLPAAASTEWSAMWTSHPGSRSP